MLRKNVSIFIAGLLLSVAIAESGMRAISPLLGPPLVSWNTMEDAKKVKLQEFSEIYPRPKFVFMGNSTTLIGVNPSIFNESVNLPSGSSFNAAMNGSNIRTMRNFALEFIVEKVRPQHLVILFSNISMAEDQTYKELDTQSKFILNFLDLLIKSI